LDADTFFVRRPLVPNLNPCMSIGWLCPFKDD
jgi:hypothetical protein